MKKITAIIVAAGSGTRMGGAINKVFLPLGDATVIDHTLKAVSQCEMVNNIILVTRNDDTDEAKEHIKYINKPVKVVTGGKTRQESVKNGLYAAEGADIVVIHDGARALITEEIINKAIDEAIKYGAAAAGVPVKDTLKQIDGDGFIEKTLDREITYQIQTPQVFIYKDILKAHEAAEKEMFFATDDCALYEKYTGKIKITQGSYENIKITTPDDIVIGNNILKNRNKVNERERG